MHDTTQHLIEKGALTTPALIKALREIDRRDFLRKEDADSANVNAPIPIGYGQTNSQPETVVFMLELLALKEGLTVLDVGSGSGWQTALIASMVGNKGRVYALEVIPELVTFGKKNVSKYNFVKSGRVTFHRKSGWEGLGDYAPYDRIIVAAAADAIPDILIEQLRAPGRLVVPVGERYSQDIVLVCKDAKGTITEKRFPGFVFVPFVRI